MAGVAKLANATGSKPVVLVGICGFESRHPQPFYRQMNYFT